MSKLLVIVGSTRPGRAADLVVPWVTSRARGHGGFDVEVSRLAGPGRTGRRAGLTTSKGEIS